MEGNTARKLEAIDLIKLYGLIEYQWDLQSDIIQWRGPLNKLLSPEVPLISGSSYNNSLDIQNFWIRLQGLMQATFEHPHFQIKYALNLPYYTCCPVEEQGEIFYDENHLPLGIKGSLKFLGNDSEDLKPKNLSGYDPLTGFSGKEVLLETLSSHLEESQQSAIPGAYLAVTIDKLTYYACRYGINFAIKLIKEMGDSIRHAIRFNDFMGRTSGCCFGIVLKDCDRWGIIRASDRLILSSQKIKISLEDGTPITPTLSIGGLVFPGEALDPAKIMQRAEKYLFEAQNIKGYNVAGTPYNMKTMPELERPVDNIQGKRRTKDLKKIVKEIEVKE